MFPVGGRWGRNHFSPLGFTLARKLIPLSVPQFPYLLNEAFTLLRTQLDMIHVSVWEEG